MYRETQEPTVRVGERSVGSDKFDVINHPAYGTITMTTTSSGCGKTLFGSDIDHNHTVRITISHAEVHRNLCRDWVHPGNQLISFQMSQAQFAQFITSAGNGVGTPITIEWLPQVGHIPEIRNPKTKSETHRREIRDAAVKAQEKMAKDVAALKALLASGKIGKRDLAEIVRSMEINLGNAPANMAFVVESAEEALSKAESDAKIEVESYIQMAASRLGLKNIGELAQQMTVGHMASAQLEASDLSVDGSKTITKQD